MDYGLSSQMKSDDKRQEKWKNNVKNMVLIPQNFGT